MISYKTNDFESPAPSVVALGCFDGVHIGHSAVISKAVSIAKERSLMSAVWCFDSPPKNFFDPSSAPVLTTPNEKRKLIEALGVELLVCVPFDLNIGALSPEEFFNEILVKRLHAKHIVCGFNYSFGKNGKGDTKLLAKLCSEIGIDFTALPPILRNGETISSSAIRAMLSIGNTEDAAKLLGRKYSITSKVINGNHLGRTLGFPTANIALNSEELLLKKGVYVVRALCEYGAFFGITNVGTHPTVFPNLLLAETNLFDFSGDLYEKKIKIEFLEFVRPERTFESIDELSAQVSNDIELAKKIIMKKYSK